MTVFGNLPSYLTYELVYVMGSLLVAVLIWVENTMLARNGGKLPSSRLFTIISVITSSWLVVSGLALYFLDFYGVMMSVPVVYGIYSLMGWVYGARLINDVPDDPKDLVVPAKYLTYAKSFSLVFAGLCVAMLMVVART